MQYISNFTKTTVSENHKTHELGSRLTLPLLFIYRAKHALLRKQLIFFAYYLSSEKILAEIAKRFDSA